MTVRAKLIQVLKEKGAEKPGAVVRYYEDCSVGQSLVEISQSWDSLPRDRKRHHLNNALNAAVLPWTVVDAGDGSDLWVHSPIKQTHPDGMRGDAVAVQIPDCYKPPKEQGVKDCYTVEEKRARVRIQTEQTLKNGTVTCRCGWHAHVRRFYKCLFCGEWFCATCAEEHFGKTREEFRKEAEKEETGMKRMNFLLEKPAREQLARIQALTGKSKSEVVRLAIELLNEVERLKAEGYTMKLIRIRGKHQEERGMVLL